MKFEELVVGIEEGKMVFKNSAHAPSLICIANDGSKDRLRERAAAEGWEEDPCTCL